MAELSRQIRTIRGPAKDPKWYINGAGRFANDPLFEEMVRAGREYRESLRPKQAKKSGKKKAGKSRAASRQRKDSRARP